MGIDIVRSLPEEEWRRFVEEHPQGNIFHTPEMFRVFAQTRGNQPELWAAFNGYRILSLLLPVQITLKGGLLSPLTTRAVVYGSILCAPGVEGQESLATLLHSYTNEVSGHPLFTELRNISDLSDVQPILERCGFIHEDHLNYLIKLDQSKEYLWDSIGRNRQKCVRSSLNKDTWVEEVTEQQKIVVAYKLIHKVFKRVHVPLPDITLFEAAFDILYPLGMFKVFIAYSSETSIGALMVLIYKDVIIGWYGGSDRAFSSYNTDSLLIWHVLEWGNEHNFRLFDFGGGGKPEVDYGPRRFKVRWGGTQVNYGRNIYIHAPYRLSLSKIGYQFVRNFL